MNFGILKPIFKFITVLCLLIIYSPILGILIGSFLGGNNSGAGMSFTLDGYAKALANEGLLSSLRNSLGIAFTCSLVTTSFALVLSYALQGESRKLILFFRKLFYLPMLLPEIVIGISLLIWFVLIHFSLGSLSLIVSHVTFTLPYAVILITLGIEGIDGTLMEAAKDLGANANQIFFKLTLPLLKPSLIGVFLVSFVISFDDFLISYFTAGAGTDTLPIKLYSLMRFGLSGELKAISSLILAGSFICTAFIIKLVLSRTTRTRLS